MAAKKDSKESMAKSGKDAQKPDKSDSKDTAEKKSIMPILLIVVAICVVGALIGAYLMLGGQPVNPPAGTNGTVQMNDFQYCASEFNKQYLLKYLVKAPFEGTVGRTYIIDMPKTLSCGGADYTYSFNLTDGYVQTTLNGFFVRNSFKEGIVVKDLTVPESNISVGILVYASVVAQGQVSYAYETKAASILSFDKYDPKVAKSYNIRAVPTVVFNCNQAYIDREDVPVVVENSTGRQVNLSELVVSEALLGRLACIHNKGEPVDVCSNLGITKTGNSTLSIDPPLPPEVLFLKYDTGVPSCRPSDGVVKVEAFYPPAGCALCLRQREVLNKIKGVFGDAMDLTYYCVGNETESAQCKKFVQASV